MKNNYAFIKNNEVINIVVFEDETEELLNHFKSSDIIHLTGYRWHPYYRILLVNLLKKIDNQMEKKLRLTYGEYNWNTHSF
jgi:hypothetical protein